MAEAEEVPWRMLAVVAGGLLALGIVVRGVVAIVRMALGEAHYRANDPDTWFKWIGK